MNITQTPIAAIRQALRIDHDEAKAFFNDFLKELVISRDDIQHHYQALNHAMTDSDRQAALEKLERAVHKLKGAACFGHVPALKESCAQFNSVLYQQVNDNQPNLKPLTSLYQQVMTDIATILDSYSPTDLTNAKANVNDDNLTEFLTQWDSAYQTEVKKLSLFNPDHTAQWSMAQKQQFVRLFYHARGHFYKFLWLLGNVAPNKDAKAKVMENIDEEFGGDGLSHEHLYYEFAKVLNVDISTEFFTEPSYSSYLQQYNLGHLTWLNQQDWQGKWAGFSAYERLDNIDYHHLELLVKSFGITGKGLAFFKVHNKADHFDRTYTQRR